MAAPATNAFQPPHEFSACSTQSVKLLNTCESTCKGPKAATAGKAVLAYGNTLDYTQARAPPPLQLFAHATGARDSQ